eukprot:CAMPEP_0118654376 /NCGR_PEP_ID=MMETSP0785-20121206/12360_1 /TAXON_ID=91992 /ORGANISM="Bolidomonas pacifica, Strain CCMP 1866" /LENGTH=101 /DNA_ID=CAMNT_0006547039 /DNA_START=279 /DNA_END=581 /DNA_ORIENTATION=+
MNDDYPLPPSDSSLSSPPPPSGPHPCALCCLIFSLFAISVLVPIGMLFSSDPVYVMNPEEGLTRKEAGANAYGAAGCYVVTAGISAFYYFRDRKVGREEEY